MKTTYSMALALAAITALTISLPARATETDDRIESSFEKSYIYKTYLKDEHIKISSKDGAVTLAGDVINEDHKPMAQNTAEALPGVTSVDNRIEVKGEHPAEMSDGWIGMKVKSALLFHRNVNASKTEVSVLDGNVLLKGEASSVAQRELTGEYAKDVAGVKSVRNEMTVAATLTTTEDAQLVAMDDASITAQVKGSLLSHRSTSALKTRVTTNDGVVTVSGSARNAAEKSLVTKLIEDINGVKSVVNNMTIDTASSN